MYVGSALTNQFYQISKLPFQLETAPSGGTTENEVQEDKEAELDRHFYRRLILGCEVANLIQEKFK